MKYPINKHLSAGPFAGGAYRDSGAGFPVVLVHGFPEDGAVWEAQAALLGRRHYRVIVPDLPGSGSSPLPAAALTIESMADFVYAILLQEGVEKCILAGHSMGGYITLAFAEKYPGMLRGFGLFNSSALADTEEKKQARLKSIGLMVNYGAASFVRQVVPDLFGKKFRDENRPVVEELVEKGASFKADALAGYYRAMIQRPERLSVLKEAGVPVLFIIGKEDTTIPLSTILQQVPLPRTADIHIINEAGHMAMLEAATDTAAYLGDFADRCLQAG